MPTTTTIQLTPLAEKRLRQFRSPWQMRLYYLNKLPSAFFWGFRVQSITPEQTVVRLPYRWSTKNPFRSIYFAAQAGAAEFSTGILAILALSGRPAISMLVVDLKVTYSKKADSVATFTCEDGLKVFEAVDRALSSGEGQTVVMKSTGRRKDGLIVSETEITWSFKKK
ncbi:MAG: DUF4442 domain-containing protein [Phaeodactylibacter sp.]|nr:DUF4442 domain-containing protein [Phaeodactylibacter sp.]